MRGQEIEREKEWGKEWEDKMKKGCFAVTRPCRVISVSSFSPPSPLLLPSSSPKEMSRAPKQKKLSAKALRALDEEAMKSAAHKYERGRRGEKGERERERREGWRKERWCV